MRTFSAAATLAVLMGCAAGPRLATPSVTCAGPPPTVADLRPVLEQRCFSCHANDGPAAEEHDFTRVETLRAQRQQLVDAVTARTMPPPGRPQLTDAEAQILLRWAGCGAAEPAGQRTALRAGDDGQR